MRTTRHLAGPALVGGLLLLTACSGGSAEDAAPAPSDGAGQSATEEATPEETEEAVAATGPECLVGTWVADTDAMSDAILSAPGMSELSPELEVTGDAETTITEDTITTAYTDQRTLMTLTMEGKELVTDTTVNGQTVASYTATDTELTLGDVDTSGMTTDTTTTVDGQAIEVPDTEDLVQQGLDLSATSRYTCEGDTLTMEGLYNGEPTGVVQTLTRKG